MKKTKDTDELFEMIRIYLRQHIDAPCGVMPTFLLRYMCEALEQTPQITQETTAAGPELYDHALHLAMAARNCSLVVLPVADFVHFAKNKPYSEWVSGNERVYDRTKPVHICYMQEHEYRSKYVQLGLYLRGVLDSRRFYRRPIRNVRIFRFDEYPNIHTALFYAVLHNSGNPFIRRGKQYRFSI